MDRAGRIWRGRNPRRKQGGEGAGGRWRWCLIYAFASVCRLRGRRRSAQGRFSPTGRRIGLAAWMSVALLPPPPPHPHPPIGFRVQSGLPFICLATLILRFVRAIRASKSTRPISTQEVPGAGGPGGHVGIRLYWRGGVGGRNGRPSQRLPARCDEKRPGRAHRDIFWGARTGNF